MVPMKYVSVPFFIHQITENLPWVLLFLNESEVKSDNLISVDEFFVVVIDA